MLKPRNFRDCRHLYEQMIHPDVFPFVREKADSYEEYLFINKAYIEQERNGQMISRVILNEKGEPIGTINLFDMRDNTGFLGTWLGKDHHGKGYNQYAKEAFFNELFFEKGIQTVYLKVRKSNIRSQMALLKLPYVMKVNEYKPSLYQEINAHDHVYDLYEISKGLYEGFIGSSYSEEFEA